MAAYDYVVNGKPLLEWVMERQGVSTHKDSGIINNANDWVIETMNNPQQLVGIISAGDYGELEDDEDCESVA